MSEPPLLLAIDTSTEQTGIALYDGTCLDDVSWSSCREQTVLLLDEIDHQLQRSKVAVGDLGAIAVATGPGRFNALRVGMSIGKGLAMSMDIPIIGISTLAAIVHPYRHRQHPVVGVIEAGRERLVWQIFDLDAAHHRADARNTSVDEFLSSIAETVAEVCVTGEVNPTLAERLEGVAGVFVPPHAGRLGRAGAVAQLAYSRLINGDHDDIVQLEPVYLHGPRRDAVRQP